MAVPQTPKIEMPPQPPAPPRAVTAAVRRRSLMEPRVRFWWAAAVVLAAAGAYFLVTQTIDWLEELKIVRQGVAVQATVISVGEGEVEGVGNMPPTSHVKLEYKYNDQTYNGDGFLEGRTEQINPKQTVPIKVDPADPNHWTYLTEAPPLLRAYLSTVILAPFIVAAAAVSWLLRRQVLRIWTDGVARGFTVAATGQSALAPASWVVQCLPLEGRDQRLISVFVPRRLGKLEVGDVIWLIHPPGKAKSALAAMAYAGK